jgi:hypothetical protein
MRLLALLALAQLAFGADWYLFSSFRKNGETGVYFASSQDGRKWEPVNGNEPVVKTEVAGELMRDPYLVRGKDGLWHMLWTWGWNSLKLGHATSKDLRNWSAHQQIPVWQNEPKARNVWAPEMVWDEARGEWLIFWSTTITGHYPPEQENGYNHRLYAMTTKDWKTFSEPKLWFDPGFNCIDATLVRDGKQWIMIFKDERRTPEKKNLRLAFADSPAGPWTGVTETFSDSWVEGPTAVKFGSDWWIYFDRYREHRYGALRTRDWKTFTPEEVQFPADHRHGTVVRISEAEARALRASPSASLSEPPRSGSPLQSY